MRNDRVFGSNGALAHTVSLRQCIHLEGNVLPQVAKVLGYPWLYGSNEGKGCSHEGGLGVDHQRVSVPRTGGFSFTDPAYNSVGVQSVMEDLQRRQESGEEFPEEELRALEEDLTGKVCLGNSIVRRPNSDQCSKNHIDLVGILERYSLRSRKRAARGEINTALGFEYKGLTVFGRSATEYLGTLRCQKPNSSSAPR